MKKTQRKNCASFAPIESKSSERNKKEMENRSDKLNKQFK